MSLGARSKSNFDWVLILIYLALVFIGWLSIYATTYDPKVTEFFSLSNLYFKQLLFIGFGLILIVFILSLEVKFLERFSSLFYLAALVLLLGLFLFGKNVNGATSWYAIGSFTLQPSEFAKVATALALAKSPSFCNNCDTGSYYTTTTRCRKRISLCRIFLSFI